MATVGLPVVGHLNYNGYTFDGATHIKVRSEPQYDEAQRVITYVKHEITVDAIITPDSTSGTSTDSAMLNIRRRLLQQGGALILTGKGFGNDIIVNVSDGGYAGGSGAKRDVRWGPIPRILAWEPIGSKAACLVTWACTTCVPLCPAGIATTGASAKLAWNYSINFSIDRGITTRTITGYLEIPQTRRANIVLGKASTIVWLSVDREWEAVIGPPLFGFERSTNRTISKNRSRIDYTITDTEIPSNNAYPLGMTHASGDYSVRWKRGSKESVLYRSTLSMDLETAPGVSGTWAWVVFLKEAQRRIEFALKESSSSDPLKKQFAIVNEISLRESIFSRECSFRVSWVFTSSIKDFMEDSGLWTPIKGTDWNKWRQSLAHSEFHPRGVAQLSNQPGNDIIVDLCLGSQPKLHDNTLIGYGYPDKMKFGLKNKKPPKKTSWLDYFSSYTIQKSSALSKQRYLQGPETDSGSASQDEGKPSYPTRNGTADVIQLAGETGYSVIYEGNAERAGWPIPRPKIEKIGGQDAVEREGFFKTGVVANLLGIQIYRAAWSIEYELAGSPMDIDSAGPLGNPHEDIDSSDTPVTLAASAGSPTSSRLSPTTTQS